MRVLITGLPLFTERLQVQLKQFDAKNKYYRLDTYYSRKDRIKALFLLPFVDVVFSINGTVQRSRVFDLAFRLKKKVVMTWVGTDVLKAAQTREPIATYKTNAVHLCEVNWIQEELSAQGIRAEILNFAVFERTFSLNIPGAPFTVLSYIPGNRAEFYGIRAFVELAQSFPEIQFLIAGATKEELFELPFNIKALGWVEDMNAVFSKSHVCVRYPEHDGLSNFILEAMARGKEVLYKYDYPHCHFVPDVSDMKTLLKKLHQTFQAGEWKFNENAAEFVKLEFGREKVLGGLIAKLTEIDEGQ